MASLFSDIIGQRPEEIEAHTFNSLEWFQKNVRDIRRSPDKLLKENQNFVTRFELGKMYMFMYDAKRQDTLKYYDYFPLSICLRRYPTGFLGANLHYIAPKYRALLMDAMYQYIEKDETTEEAYFRVRYPMIKSISRLRWARPCLKQYQYGYVNSRIVEVQPEAMDMVVMLPSHKFKSKGTNFNANLVHRESLGKT